MNDYIIIPPLLLLKSFLCHITLSLFIPSPASNIPLFIYDAVMLTTCFHFLLRLIADSHSVCLAVLVMAPTLDTPNGSQSTIMSDTGGNNNEVQSRQERVWRTNLTLLVVTPT